MHGRFSKTNWWSAWLFRLKKRNKKMKKIEIDKTCRQNKVTMVYTRETEMMEHKKIKSDNIV